MAKKNPTPFEPEGFAPPPVEPTLKDFERLGNEQLAQQDASGMTRRLSRKFSESNAPIYNLPKEYADLARLLAAGDITKEQYDEYMRGLQVIGSEARDISPDAGAPPRSSGPDAYVPGRYGKSPVRDVPEAEGDRVFGVPDLGQTLGSQMADRSSGRPGDTRPEQIDRSKVNWNNVPFLTSDRVEEFRYKSPGFLLLSVQDAIDAGLISENVKKGWPLDEEYSSNFFNPENVGVRNPYDGEFATRASQQYLNEKDLLLEGWKENWKVALKNAAAWQNQQQNQQQDQVPGSGDPSDQDQYPGMSQEERDNAIMQEMAEPIPQSQIDAEVARREEARSAQAIEEERRLKSDPTVRRNDQGMIEQYPEEVELWMSRNASQYDLEMQDRLSRGDSSPEDYASDQLYIEGQRQRREALRGIAVGSGLEGDGLTQFEYWKRYGRWPGPYGTISPQALDAARKYTLEFGKPEVRSESLATPPYEEWLAQREQAMRWDAETASFVPDEPEEETPLSLPPGVSPQDNPEDPRYGMSDEERADYDAARRLMGILKVDESGLQDLLDEFGQSPTQFLSDVQRRRRDQAEADKETSRRNATIRAILRRDPEKRRAQLDRANQNLPPFAQIMPEEVGLPRSQQVGAVRSVSSINDVSVQTAIEGEYLRSPEGMFRVGPKSPDGTRVRVPVRSTPKGAVVPDADKMTLSDFAANYTQAERREVASLIQGGGNDSYAQQQRSILKSRYKITNSDEYSDSEKADALANLDSQEKQLHYRYLQEVLPGGASPVPLGAFPAMTSSEQYRQAQIDRAQGGAAGGNAGGLAAEMGAEMYPSGFPAAAGANVGGGNAGRPAASGATIWSNLLSEFARAVRADPSKKPEAFDTLLRGVNKNFPEIKMQEQYEGPDPDTFIRSRSEEINAAAGT